MLNIPYGRPCFYQWDLNQRLIVNDTTHNQVHFANADDQVALIMEVYEEDDVRYVNVPNILLQSTSRIIAYLCNSDEKESHTHAHYKFAIKKRPKPADYVYTETEVYNYNLKLDNNLGDENAGKALVVDEEGYIVPGEYSGGGIDPDAVKSVNGIIPDENGNVNVNIVSDLQVMELITALQ